MRVANCASVALLVAICRQKGICRVPAVYGGDRFALHNWGVSQLYNIDLRSDHLWVVIVGAIGSWVIVNYAWCDWGLKYGLYQGDQLFQRNQAKLHITYKCNSAEKKHSKICMADLHIIVFIDAFTNSGVRTLLNGFLLVFPLSLLVRYLR